MSSDSADYAERLEALDQRHRQAAAKWRTAQEAADQLQREMHEAYLDVYQATVAADRQAHKDGSGSGS